MPLATLHELIQDWGGFERLVARLNDTGTVTVQHNVVLTGKSGAPRQCDVVIRHRQGLYEHLIIVECKCWQKNVERLHVDALATTVRDLNASKGVIMTTKGFQSGATIAAEHEGIDLFRVRELTDIEWGTPGRVVNLIFQHFRRSIGKLQFHGVRTLDVEKTSIDLRLTLGHERSQSHTPMLNQDGSQGRSLEQFLAEKSLNALQDFTRTGFTINGGEECTRYLAGSVSIAPEVPMRILIDGATVLVDKITFDLGIKCYQWQYTYDRGQDYLFALAIEDCITNVVIAASQRTGSTATNLAPLAVRDESSAEDVLVNGSIVKVLLSEWFPYGELDGLTEVPGPRIPSGLIGSQ